MGIGGYSLKVFVFNEFLWGEEGEGVLISLIVGLTFAKAWIMG